MGEEIALENGRISDFRGLVTLTLTSDRVGSYCIASCITRRTVPAHQISLKSKRPFVDERTYGRTDGHLGPTNVIRSTRRSWPNSEST